MSDRCPTGARGVVNYAAVGARIENIVRADLERAGYDVVRAAASKGPADLVAVGDDEVLFIQVKRSGRISPAERVAILQLATRLVDGVAVVASKPVRRNVEYRVLTGEGPKDWIRWEPPA